MKAKLIGVSGWDPLFDVELVLPVIIGRSRRAGLLLQQPLVSRQHCELYELNGKLMIRDLGSMNGTRVNQVRIEQPTELQTGSLLTVGSLTFRIDCGDSCATLLDTRDETAVAKRSDLDQLLKVPLSDSVLAGKPSSETISADDEDAKHLVGAPATIDPPSMPTVVETSEPSQVPARTDDRSNTYRRNPR